MARDPLELARQMAGAYLARPDVAKAAAAGADLVAAFLPVAGELAPVLDALDEGFAEVSAEIGGISARLQGVLEQDRARQEELAARAGRMAAGAGRFADLDSDRLAGLREAIRTAGMAQAGHVNGSGGA